ncbi:ABC transporter ATP-binding protein [Solwaraspora sp. WMMD792]|uniref:ABC transporter ATP-binding protein n=1 Tax=Solwaraspora sp. WMMD792 TaxID=3016099 RepID=UPI002417116D|nr:ABC transporter ATP-binding protein [Solwaraspora sp. WMMD792]MDG4771056.1 ABC transporter ATP-binding protein [Solwaraspora sp. WMMD792]
MTTPAKSTESARSTAQPAPGTDAVLQVIDLTVAVGSAAGGWTDLVHQVSFEVAAGETVGLVGESGCGKSTTALALMGLLPPRDLRVGGGTVRLDGTDLFRLSRRGWEDVRGDQISMIFQEPMSSLHPAFTIGEQIAESVRRHRGLSRRAAADRAVELLDLVGVPDARSRARAYPHEFSGGMLQRVLIAIALACEPKLLVADEPTTALDVTVQAQILDLLHEMRDRFGLAVLLVTHDLGVVAEVCDRVVVMYAGQVVEECGIDTFLAGPRHPYSRALLAAAPDAAVDGELTWIPGAPPGPDELPSGCLFQPRCRYAHDACRSGPIVLRRAADGHASRCLLDPEAMTDE